MPFDLIRDKGREGRRGYTLPRPDVEMKELETILPKSVLRKEKPRLAEVDEPTVIRHYTNLSRENEGIDTTFYPLGSCTMKHNPRANEAAAVVPGFAGLHPLQPEAQAQGALRIMHELQGFLAEVSGLPYVSLQPLAGAQGELTSILMVKRFFDDAGDEGRTTVLVPSTAHGTNPATASMAGFRAKEIGLDDRGCVDVDELREMVDESTAALMITNPNTCGVYERNIAEIAAVLHEAGAFLYMDGANMNANMGRMRPAEADVDIMHFNLHKTFSTPHGGGGPGCGAIACSDDLAPFLPEPTVEKRGDGVPLRTSREDHRSRGRLPRQLRADAKGLELHQDARPRSQGRDGHGRPERQLRSGAARGNIPHTLRRAVQARGRRATPAGKEEPSISPRG